MKEYRDSILITGGTHGLGYYAALCIARQCPDTLVIIASRSDKTSAAASINNQLHQSNVQYLPLDLSSLHNVRRFASSYTASAYPPLRALLLNAGLQFHRDINYTADGIEATFGVNHIGHALLFFLLKPHLTSDARIILTASGTHDPAKKTSVPDAKYIGAERLAHPTGDMASSSWPGLQRYSTSKLCNVIFSYALDRRVRLYRQESEHKNNWTVNAFDPGLMPGTLLARDTPWPFSFIFQKVLPHLMWLVRLVVTANAHSPAESGAALARLAVGEDVKGVSGKYFEGLHEIKSSNASYEQEKQDDLWEWTVNFVAETEDEKEVFLEF